jgi:hypothetical protein
MYFLIGADGREYGPFTADQIRDWVSQGRANAHSRIRRDGETAWQALRELPEFADLVGAAVNTAPSPPPALTPDLIAADYLARNAVLDIGSCISRGWALVRDNPGLLIGGTFLTWLVVFGIAMVPIVGLVGIFLNPVLFGGLFLVVLRRIRGENPGVGDVFSGFNLAFLQLGLAGVVSTLLIAVGLVLCLIPGLYLAVGYAFTLPLVIDKRLEFWTAMEVSRQVVHRQWWTMFGLAILLILIAGLGVLACLVGLLVAGPIAVAAMMYAYEDLFGVR